MPHLTDSTPRAADMGAQFPVRQFRFVVCNTLTPGQRHNVVHRSHPVLFYVLSGSIEVLENDRRSVLNTGDFCFLDRGSSQDYGNISDENTYLYICGFDFYDPEARMRDFAIPVTGNFGGMPIVSGLFHKLHECWVEHKPGYQMRLFSLLYHILHYIALNQTDFVDIPPEYSRLQDVVRYVHDNCFRPELSLEDLCRQCNYSSTYLRKLFVKYFQMPPTKYIRHIRLELAKNMLALSRKSISQIAADVGYKDIAHFDRVFKKDTGHTPFEYRKLNYMNFATEK